MSVRSGNGETEHDRQRGSDAFGFLYRNASILRIENGLYEQGIDTSIS